MRGQMITKNEDGVLTVVLSKKIYDKPAVLRASYSISKLCTVDMRPKDNDDVSVTFGRKPGQESLDLEKIAHRFCNEVVDQQIRLDLERRTKGVREIIIRHAFEPIADLKSAVEDEE